MTLRILRFNNKLVNCFKLPFELFKIAKVLESAFSTFLKVEAFFNIANFSATRLFHSELDNSFSALLWVKFFISFVKNKINK